jgi:glycosyltransferase involved in cell wall biosynthesis
MNQVKTSSISILIPSYNTPKSYLIQCIKSIINQTCIKDYKFEIVWINDGSNEEKTLELEQSLKLFNIKPNIHLIYKKLDENKGIVDALNIGLDLCTNELIFRMDSDDIMFPERIQKQITFMEKNPQCMILGTQIQEFKLINEIISYKPINLLKKHQDFISWMQFLEFPFVWFMNHPTLCYRKQAIQRIGKYNSNDSIIKYSAMEDYELELRFLKTFGAVYNLQEPLVYYRNHDNQHSKNNKHIDINIDTKKYILQSIILQ